MNKKQRKKTSRYIYIATGIISIIFFLIFALKKNDENPILIWIFFIGWFIMGEMLYIGLCFGVDTKVFTWGENKAICFILSFFGCSFIVFISSLSRYFLPEVIKYLKNNYIIIITWIGYISIAALIFFGFCYMNKKIAIKIRGGKDKIR